jgi:rhodanese-related sulfurtransferase
MKKIQFNIVLILILSLGLTGCGQTVRSTASKDEAVSLITPEELSTIPDDVQLIDIRTPQEFDQGHIKNAVNIDFYKPGFMKKMEEELDKNKDLYIYCRSGHRSGIAAQNLSSSGFKKIYDLKGGINNWHTKNLKIIR